MLEDMLRYAGLSSLIGRFFRQSPETQGIVSNPMRSSDEDAQDDIQQIQRPLSNESQDDSFNKTLFKLSEDITDEKFMDLKRRCTGKLAARELQSLKHPYDLFHTLHKKGLIHETNTTMVETLLSDIGLNAMVGKYLQPSAIQGVSPDPRATQPGQGHPAAKFTPASSENQSDSAQQITDGPLWDKTETLRKYLKDKYKRHYSKLLPIPWNDDIHLDLHDVYTTLEVKKVKGDRVTLKEGAALENLHDMFNSSDTRRIRIEGAPAMGKSTLCRKLAYDWSCGELQQYTLLFFLEMRHIAKTNMIDEILNQLIPDDYELLKEEVSEVFSKNIKCVLFLCDGLDEPDECQVVSSEIPELISEALYSWCTVVITTRPQLCNKYLNRCDLYLQVKGFTSKRTNEYILKYFKDDTEIDNMTLNDIGMNISSGTDTESVCSVITKNKYAKSMTIYGYYYCFYYYYYCDFTDQKFQSIVAALRENKVLKHFKIEILYDYDDDDDYDDDVALSAMNNVLIPVSKAIETNQVTLDSITLRAFIKQNSSECTELQSIVSEQEKQDNWYHHVYQSVDSEYHYHLIRYTSEHPSNAM
ncbi:uncharacterized protein [Ptychodera flava]|uniref:uncharacterized protein n=1 Tax=Ptychodera flava TaxID=63121 RepID=UPI00396A0245